MSRGYLKAHHMRHHFTTWTHTRPFCFRFTTTSPQTEQSAGLVGITFPVWRFTFPSGAWKFVYCRWPVIYSLYNQKKKPCCEFIFFFPLIFFRPGVTACVCHTDHNNLVGILTTPHGVVDGYRDGFRGSSFSLKNWLKTKGEGSRAARKEKSGKKDKFWEHRFLVRAYLCVCVCGGGGGVVN